jgi:hypothetical protein
VTKRMYLAKGMTVQMSGPLTSTNLKRVAHCVICGWRSEPMSYDEAHVLACSEGSHDCPGPPRR